MKAGIFQFADKPTLNLDDDMHYRGEAESLGAFEDLLYVNVVPNDGYEEGFVVIESPGQYKPVRWFEIGEKSRDRIYTNEEGEEVKYGKGLTLIYSLFAYMDIREGDRVTVYHNHPPGDQRPFFSMWPSPFDFMIAAAEALRVGYLGTIQEGIEVHDRVISERGVFSYRADAQFLEGLDASEISFLILAFSSEFDGYKLPPKVDAETGNVRTDAERMQEHIANVSEKSFVGRNSGRSLLGGEFMKMEFVPSGRKISRISDAPPRSLFAFLGVDDFINSNDLVVVGMRDANGDPVRLKRGDKIVVRKNGRIIDTSELFQDQDVGLVFLRDLLPKNIRGSRREDAEAKMPVDIVNKSSFTFAVRRDGVKLSPVSVRDCGDCLSVMDRY